MVDKSKFDIQGILGNIKTMINPTANTPNPSAEDAIGMKLAELSLLVQGLQASYVEQGKQLAKANKLFNELYQELVVQRQGVEENSTTSKPKAKAPVKKKEK